ncbi:hypothetical protein [Zhihengliuella sp.]|uniref:hypothetical protein n=1 Tax=Zhihengliuella sp. TaxID=1954483 RepID=UPI002810B694|nr:hypothetical protein [Zhihengliuella sp.]
MRTSRSWTAPQALAAAAAALLLAGCAGPGVAESRAGGTPDGVELPVGDEALPVVVDVGDGTVQVVTWGSSSCLPVATSFENDGDRLTVVFEEESDGPCTADFTGTTHTFSADTVGGPVPDEARIVFAPEGGEETVDVVHR